MRHWDIADGDRYFEVVNPGLVEQPPRLVVRSGDIAREAGYLDQLRFRCGHAGARPHDAADTFEESGALQLRRRTPAGDGKRESAPYPRIVERRALGVEHDQQSGEPWAFTNRDPIAERFDEVIALRRSDPTELGSDAAALVCLEHRLCRHEIG